MYGKLPPNLGGTIRSLQIQSGDNLMKPESKKYTTTVGNHTLSFETGKLAGQAGGAVTFGTPESIVFAAATMGGVREGIDFFPLQVEYEERMYAGGKIPGSFFRREGRPGTDAILVARLKIGRASCRERV